LIDAYLAEVNFGNCGGLDYEHDTALNAVTARGITRRTSRNDNSSFDTTFGPSAATAINLSSEQTPWVYPAAGSWGALAGSILEVRL
jgi:hypothetical protein